MPEMPQPVWDLLSTLRRRTDTGELMWRKGATDTEFVLPADSGSITVSSTDGDGRHPLEFTIVSPEGVVVDSWRSVEGNELTDWYDEIGRLYESARRSALGSTKVVSDLLKELAPPPPPDDDIPF